MLFDLVADPHEQSDLAQQHPEVCREGAWRLSNWHEEQMQTMAADGPDVVDPLWTVVREGGPFHARHLAPTPLPAYLKRLEATGRAEGAQQLREKYGRSLQGQR
jgi:choline-sulfatase